MYLVIIAWLYVTLMMAVAEATSTTGTLLGASITFVLYGLLPVALIAYLMSTPARRKAIRAREARARQKDAAQSLQQVVNPAPDSGISNPDAGGETTAPTQEGLVAPEREKP